MITLGSGPDTLSVTIIPGQRFMCALQAVEPDEVTPTDWPPGVVITLNFGDPGPQWVAVIDVTDGSLAKFQATPTQVDALIGAAPAGARLVIDGYRVGTGCVRVLHDGIS